MAIDGSARGILVGQDHQAAALARHRAHEGPLRHVPLPGRAEDGDQAASAGRGDRGKQVEHRLEGGRLWA